MMLCEDAGMKIPIHIKLDDDLKSIVRAAAKAERKTITSWITPLLIKELKRLGVYQPPKSQKAGEP